MTVIPLRFSLLAIAAGLGISWILARFQHRLITVNGMGTQLYGREPGADPGSFVSTKWLVLPGLPLLPVRSYLVTTEGLDIWKKPVYHHRPLDRMHWPQVGETARHTAWRYGIAALIPIGLALWAISECR